MSRTLETPILKACLDFLLYHKFFVWRQNQGGIALPNGSWRRFTGKKGVSDILGCLPDGRFLAVEVKRPEGKLSPDQMDFLHTIDDLGGVALWVSSTEELERDLTELGIIKTPRRGPSSR